MPSCYANQLEANLRKGLPVNQVNVVLLWGEDAGAIRQAAQQAVSLNGVDPADPFAADSFSLTDLAAQPSLLPDKAGTVPFGGGRSLVRLVGVSGEETATQVRPLTEAVQTLLGMPLHDVLVLLPVPALLDKTHALVKAVEQHATGLSVRFFQDNQRDLLGWLQNELRAQQRTIDPDALTLLASLLGADRELARRELEKLVLYTGANPAQPISADDIQASVAGATPADIFKLADAVGRRDPVAADRILEQLMEQGEDLNGALSQVQRHLGRLAAIQEAISGGNSPENAVRALRPPVPQPQQADLVRQAQKYPPRRLAGLNAYVLETIVQARSGVLDGQHVLSRALLALSA